MIYRNLNRQCANLACYCVIRDNKWDGVWHATIEAARKSI